MITLLATGGGVAALGFACVWIFSVRKHNYGFLDVAWSLSIAVLATMYALLGDGYTERKVAFTAVGAAWSLRLGGPGPAAFYCSSNCRR
jgi:steroid 5-alpha reductase family enzyme